MFRKGTGELVVYVALISVSCAQSMHKDSWRKALQEVRVQVQNSEYLQKLAIASENNKAIIKPIMVFDYGLIINDSIDQLLNIMKEKGFHLSDDQIEAMRRTAEKCVSAEYELMDILENLRTQQKRQELIEKLDIKNMYKGFLGDIKRNKKYNEKKYSLCGVTGHLGGSPSLDKKWPFVRQEAACFLIRKKDVITEKMVKEYLAGFEKKADQIML
ncbi:MAG TPA: hypothetical protein VEK38_01725 [Candidatus Bathyarchaeia archaeon]|nr:hypothetical protein [Candidatus Bathyarchaeia archaeon]